MADMRESRKLKKPNKTVSVRRKTPEEIPTRPVPTVWTPCGPLDFFINPKKFIEYFRNEERE